MGYTLEDGVAVSFRAVSDGGSSGVRWDTLIDSVAMPGGIDGRAVSGGIH